MLQSLTAGRHATFRLSAPRGSGKQQEPTMKKMFGALTVLTLVFGTVALAAPANASKVYLFAPNQNEGGNN
jgi:hypothetical protein